MSVVTETSPGPEQPGPAPVQQAALEPVPVEHRLRHPAHRGLAIGVVGVVVAIAFEAIAVATAMPVAARELDGLRAYGLAFSVFLTASLLGMVVAGELSDRRGPVLPFLVAAGVFGAGLLLAGVAPSMWVLVLARAVQGFGGGLNVVALYVVVGRAFPETLRPRVFSALSSGWILPALVGPPVAGYLADSVSWRWVFLGVLPLLVASTLLVLPHLRGLSGPPEGALPAPRRSRLLPALGAAVGAGLLQYAGQVLTWWSVPMLVVGLLLLGATVPRLLPAGALRLARGLPTVVVLRGVFAGAFFGAETFVPLMLVEERGLSTTLAGASLTGGALTWALGSWYQGRSGLRFSRVTLITSGFVLQSAGIALVALTTSASVPPALAATGWLLAGLGMGLGLTSLSVLVLELSPVAEQGANSAALQVSDGLGSILAIGAAAALFAGLHDGHHGNGAVFVLIYLVMFVVSVLGAFVAGRARVPSAA